MANWMNDYSPGVSAYLQSSWDSAPSTPFHAGGDFSQWQQNAAIDNGFRQMGRQRDIEWANRQRMYDPNFWAQAFGMGGGGATKTTTPSENWYETRLKSLMDNPDSIANTGAYKFAFNQGQEALNRQLAAKGMLNSGNRLYELTKFGQGLASQQYGQEMDRLGNLASNRYSADTSRYAAELSGQNQLRSMMMQNMLNQMNRAEQSAPRYW